MAALLGEPRLLAGADPGGAERSHAELSTNWGRSRMSQSRRWRACAAALMPNLARPARRRWVDVGDRRTAGPTTCATPPYRPGSTQASPPPRSPNGPGTAPTCCCGSTSNASPGSKARPSAASRTRCGEPEPDQPDSTGPAQQREAEAGATEREHSRAGQTLATYLAQPPAHGRFTSRTQPHTPGPWRRLPQTAKGAGQPLYLQVRRGG